MNDTAAAAPGGNRLKWHPMSRKPDLLNDWEWIEETAAWLTDEANGNFAVCQRKTGGRVSCCCFTPLSNINNSYCVAEYMLQFCQASSTERDRIVLDMVRYQSGTIRENFPSHCYYKIPCVFDVDFLSDQAERNALQGHYICQNALQHILKYGKVKMKRIRDDVKAGLMFPLCKNTNKGRSA